MTSEPIRRTREVVRAAIVHTIQTLDVLIAENARLAEVPEHRESAERRITEAEEELARARAELDALDRGEWPVREIHDESPYHDA